MTTPDTPPAEAVCAACGHDGHAPMKVGGVVVRRDTYCWLCNNEHPYNPISEPEADAPSQSTEPPCGACGKPESDRRHHGGNSRGDFGMSIPYRANHAFKPVEEPSRG